MKRSQTVALISVFAALNVVCDSLVGLPQDIVWYGWIFVIEPLNGIVLGPWAGFLSTLIGVMVGHSIYFRGEFEYVFSVGAPLGAMVSGLIYQKRLKPAFAYFAVLLTAYFLTPVARSLPLWGMWDTFLAFAVLCATLVLSKKLSNIRQELYVILIAAFVGLEADILFRIFILVPCQTYQFFFTTETLQVVWGAAALVTPIQAAVSMAVTALVGPRALQLILRNVVLEKP